MVSKRNNLVILDCQKKTALNSISRIYQVDEKDIVDFFNGFDLEKYWLENDLYKEKEIKTTLIRLFGIQFGELKQLPDIVCWFHATRVLENEKFEDGILPLSKIVEKIWDIVFNIFDDSFHRDRLMKIKENWDYNDRLSNHHDFGAFGQLVREAILHSKELINNDYLDIPEFIQDICRAFKEKYDEDIEEDLKKCLVPCIVKFKSSKYISSWHVKTALFYLYYDLNG